MKDKDKRKIEDRLGITEGQFEDMADKVASRMDEGGDPPPMPKWGGPCVPKYQPRPRLDAAMQDKVAYPEA